MGGGGRSLTSAGGRRTTSDGNVKGYRPRHSGRSVMVADGGLVVVVVVVEVTGGGRLEARLQRGTYLFVEVEGG